MMAGHAKFVSYEYYMSTLTENIENICIREHYNFGAFKVE